jgi:hypothetical protein
LIINDLVTKIVRKSYGFPCDAHLFIAYFRCAISPSLNVVYVFFQKKRIYKPFTPRHSVFLESFVRFFLTKCKNNRFSTRPFVRLESAIRFFLAKCTPYSGFLTLCRPPYSCFFHCKQRGKEQHHRTAVARSLF